MPGIDRSIVEHRLPIKLGYRPYHQGARRCNPKVLPDIKAEITRLIEAKFIRQCRYAEWISNVVPVYKKNGKLRVCIDFRNLNKATPMDGYAMPIADMLVDAAAGHKVISFMDGNAGYNHIFYGRRRHPQDCVQMSRTSRFIRVGSHDLRIKKCRCYVPEIHELYLSRTHRQNCGDIH